jgi:hypothetical protein
VAGFNSDEVLVAVNGHVYVGPVGTAAPADPSIAFSTIPAWIDVGYLNEDGLQYTQGRDTDDVPVWQSFQPVKKLVTGANVTMGMSFMQWNKTTLPLAFGGGTIVASGTGATLKYTFTPNDIGTLDEVAVAFDWVNSLGKVYRLFITKAVISDEVSFSLSKNAAAELPVVFTALASGTTLPYTWYTNDPAANPA